MWNLRLFEFTGVDAHTSFALPCREILRNGSPPISVIGPPLEGEAAQSHEGYWHQESSDHQKRLKRRGFWG